MKAEIKATKALDRKFTSDDKFRFMITAADGTPMPENTVVTIEDLDTSESRKTFTFGNVTYDLDDLGGENSKVFTYTLVETAANQSGITYDESALKLYIKVTRNRNTGKLGVEYSLDNQTFVPSIDNATPVFNNKYKSPDVKGGITVIKKWDDANDQDGIRPNKITVVLKNEGGEEKARKDLTQEKNWTHTFDVPEYEADGKTKIKYSAEEIKDSVITGTDGKGTYAIDVKGTGTSEDPFVITNKHTPETVGKDEPVDPEDPEGPKKKVVRATKVWNDKDDEQGMRDDVELTLSGKVTEDGMEKVVYTDSKTISKDATGDALIAKWENVPAKYNGLDIEYKVTENALFGYETEVTGNVTDGFTVKNTWSDDIPATVKVTKEWQDADNVDKKRPEKVTFALMQKVGKNGTPTEYDAKEVDVESDGSASYTWSKLPVEVDGKAALYSVEEKDIPEGYTAQVIATAPGEFKVVNTHKPDTYGDPDDPTKPTDPDFKGIKVNKLWSDDRDAHGDRPDHVVFHLYANGTDTGKSAVAFGDHQADSWDAVGWTGLQKNDENGPIKYTVREENVPNYDAAVGGDETSGFTVTNTHNTASDTIKLVIVKEWQDEDGNVIEVGPKAAKIHVMEKVGKYGTDEVDSFEFEEGASGDALTKTFDEMPTLDHGIDIVYSVKEDKVPGYKTTYEDGVYSDEGKTLTLKVINKKKPVEPDDDEPVILQFVDYLNEPGTQIVSATDTTYGEAKKVDDVKPEKDPEHPGYDFQQWDMNYATTEDGNVTVVYVARYQDKMKVVSYVDGQAEKGKVLVKTEKTNDPSSVVDPAEDPVHEGLRFIGWQEVEDAAGNIIRVAKYEPKTTPTPDKNHCYVDPPVRKAIKGHPRTTPEFTFTFSRITKNAPMPEGSIGGKKTMTLSGGGEIEFGWIEYTKEGTYEYSIAEEKDATRDWKYEASKFKMVVVVSRDKNGNLAGKRTLYKDGKEITNMQTAIFTNTYTGDDTDDGTYYDDDGDGNGKSGKNGKSAHKNSTSTGDNSNLLPWIIAMILAFASVNYILIRRKMEK